MNGDRVERYCLGFMFDQEFRSVLLIRKARPAWQRGRLNGVGGHLDPGESALEAMVREFREEAGLVTAREQWREKLVFWGAGIDGRDWIVTTFVTTGRIDHARGSLEEPLVVVPARLLPPDVISNLRWIIPLLTDQDTRFATVTVNDGLVPTEERVAR